MHTKFWPGTPIVRARYVRVLTLAALGLVAIAVAVPSAASARARHHHRVAARSAAAAQGFQRGANFTNWNANGFSSLASDSSLKRLASDHNNYVSIVPTWYMATSTSSTINADPNLTPTDASVLHAMQKAQALGMKVMVKPHVDVLDGSWRGGIAPTDVWGWWHSYQAFIYHYAQLAQQGGATLLVVGTELKTMTVSGWTGVWNKIISDIRGYFSGQLTYAANSDEFLNVGFWPSLDYIGVDAYFSLSSVNDPTVAALNSAWQSTGDFYWLHTASTYWNKPLLFTEIGYRSTPDDAINPALWGTPGTVDLQAQQNAYESAYETFYNQPWFAGIYWWNWPSQLPANGNNTDYPPVYKPAESTLNGWNQYLAYTRPS
jgi:hypothetical protein